MGIKFILTFFVTTFFDGEAEIRHVPDIVHEEVSTTWGAATYNLSQSRLFSSSSNKTLLRQI